MKKIRLLALCVALLQLLLLFAACGGDSAVTTGASTTETPTVGTTAGKTEPSTTAPPATEPGTTVPPATEPSTTVPPATEPSTTVPPVTEPGTTVPPVTEPSTTVPPVTEPPVEEDPYIIIAKDGVALYTIVKSVTCTAEVNALVSEFIEELNEITGASFADTLDSSAPTSNKEILVCAYRNRPGLEEHMDSVTYTGYCVGVVGERIVLSTYADYTNRLLNFLLDELIQFEDGSWGFEREYLSYSYERDEMKDIVLPTYLTSEGRVAGDTVYLSNEYGYTVAIEKTNREEFDAYLAKLERLGYTKYAENTIGYVNYYTYTQDEETLHVQYVGPEVDPVLGAAARITLTKDQWLPPVDDPVPYEKLVDSSINNIARVQGAGGWGMGMIFQIADGSYIIVDGALHTAQDQKALLDFMVENKPASHPRPVVSCWLWTHAHGDHVDLCRKALSSFRTQVDVKMFAYNYPLFEKLPESADAGVYYSTQLIDETKKQYPEAIHWIMHAGQKYSVADAEIQCWWTHEDVHPMGIYGVNDTDTVFSITIDGVRTMMLGDCENPNSKMITYFQEAMRSPVVQNAHHTLNGPKQMYEYIDPIYSFWACSRAEMDAKNRGGSEHGQYLLYTEWTRTDEDGNVITGPREHFNNSVTTRLYIKDLKVELEGLS